MFRVQAAGRSRTVVLGQAIDRTGSIATPSWSDSIRLAVGTANQALKQAGHTNLRFEVAEANSGNVPAMARDGAIQLVNKDGAKAIITDSSQDDIGIVSLAYDGDAAHELSVPVVCMACTSPAIDDPGAIDPDAVKQAALRNSRGWNFRTTLSDAYQARVLAHLLTSGPARGDSNDDGHLKLGIYASDDPYGHGFSQSLAADVRESPPPRRWSRSSTTSRPFPPSTTGQRTWPASPTSATRPPARRTACPTRWW